MSYQVEIQLLKNALQRERKARKIAEQFLEAKSAELYDKNQELLALNKNLAHEVESRTKEVEKLAFITASSPSPIFIVDAVGYISIVNNSGNLLAPTENLPDEAKHELKKLKGFALNALQSNTVTANVFSYRQRFYNVIFSPIAERQYVVAYAQDVTSSVRHEQELEASEAKYRGILENLNLGIVETNEESHIVKAYPSFCNTTGYNPDELFNRHIDEFITYGSLKNTNDQSVKEARLKRKDGKHLWVVVSNAPITKNHEHSGVIYVLLDISEQKNTLLKLEVAIKEAEEAQRTEKYFVEQISHEIRTPINGLLGMAHILKEQYPESPIVDQLLVSGKYLNKLIGQVLELAKIEGDQGSIEKESFTTDEISNLVQVSFNEFIKEQKHSLQIEMNDTTFSNFIGDKKGLSQIIHNLVSNAIKYGNGKVTLEWKVASNNEGDFLSAMVSDNGDGISPENREVIFQKYQRLSDAKHKDGLGLGLHVSSTLAEAMGGKLSLVSSNNNGSTFQLLIPVEIITLEKNTKTKVNKMSFEGKHCVIAEDNTINFEYLNYYLQKAKVSTSHYLNGQELLENIKSLENTDVFILDYKMPGMNGIELSKKIQQVYPTTPIVLLTANAIPKQLKDARKEGIQEVLFKPISPEAIDQLLERLFKTEEEKVENIWTTLHQLGGSTTALKEIYGNDAEYAFSIVNHICTSKESLVKELSQLKIETNAEAIRNTIHKTLPTLGMMGLTNLMNKGKLLEKEAHTSNPNNEVIQWCDEFIAKLHMLNELTAK